jgi:hypothetical protein
MIDLWLFATDAELLAAWCAAQDNVLGPKVIRGLSYACVRLDHEPTLPAAFMQLTPTEGRAVLGDWA